MKKTTTKTGVVEELTLIPREVGGTTESAYQRSLQASPSFSLQPPKPQRKKKVKLKKRKKK